MISPSCGFSFAVSGMMIPPAVLDGFGFDPANDHAVMKRGGISTLPFFLSSMRTVRTVPPSGGAGYELALTKGEC